MSPVPSGPGVWGLGLGSTELLLGDVGINMRGMSASQKEIVMKCERRRMAQPKRVVDEFNRLATEAIASNATVIPTPTTVHSTIGERSLNIFHSKKKSPEIFFRQNKIDRRKRRL